MRWLPPRKRETFDPTTSWPVCWHSTTCATRAVRGGRYKEMERALDHSPVDSLSPLDRPYLTLATLYALARQPRRSRLILDASSVPSSRSCERPPSSPSGLGRAPMASSRSRKGAPRTRSTSFARPCVGGTCTPCGLEALGRAYEVAGRTDSAIAVYRRRIDRDHIQQLVLDAVELPLIYRQLGDLYARSGDRARAREYYSRLLELWKNCRPGATTHSYGGAAAAR